MRLGGMWMAIFRLLEYTYEFSVRCQNREEHSPLAIHTAAFGRALVMLALGLYLCYGESNNLT
jgi:hypothetical protein